MKSKEMNGHELRPVVTDRDSENNDNKQINDDQKRPACWKCCKRNKKGHHRTDEEAFTENLNNIKNSDSTKEDNKNENNDSSKMSKSVRKLFNSKVMDIKQMSAKERAFLFLKKFIAFLFSTIGTTVAMISYTILGGLIFSRLETSNEEVVSTEVQKKLRESVLELWSLNEKLNVFHPLQWQMGASEILNNYTRVIFHAVKDLGWDGKYLTVEDQQAAIESGEYQPQWGFAGALLYSITVVTTIGYGHIAPKTTWGKVITMLYALFGIPLTLLAVTSIGRAMAMAFRFIYRNLITVLCCLPCRHSFVKMIISPPPDSGEYDEENYEVEVLADPENPDSVKSELRQPVPEWRKNLRFLTCDMKVIEQVVVPIPVTMLLIAGYIGLGSILFGIWEKWEAIEAAYFCFVTLSTIGFGDYVPGTDMEEEGAASKLVLCAMYLFIGLAYLAMAFDLMQEGVKSIFRKIGQKLGLFGENE